MVVSFLQDKAVTSSHEADAFKHHAVVLNEPKISITLSVSADRNQIFRVKWENRIKELQLDYK
jgi:hypothetical protein